MIDRANAVRRRAPRVLFIALGVGLAAGALVAACGGSASESPWPVEPERIVTDPEGEEGRAPPRREPRPDAGPIDRDGGPNVEP